MIAFRAKLKIARQKVNRKYQLDLVARINCMQSPLLASLSIYFSIFCADSAVGVQRGKTSVHLRE
jgi:hypothetical protein